MAFGDATTTASSGGGEHRDVAGEHRRRPVGAAPPRWRATGSGSATATSWKRSGRSVIAGRWAAIAISPQPTTPTSEPPAGRATFSRFSSGTERLDHSLSTRRKARFRPDQDRLRPVERLKRGSTAHACRGDPITAMPTTGACSSPGSDTTPRTRSTGARLRAAGLHPCSPQARRPQPRRGRRLARGAVAAIVSTDPFERRGLRGRARGCA